MILRPILCAVLLLGSAASHAATNGGVASWLMNGTTVASGAGILADADPQRGQRMARRAHARRERRREGGHRVAAHRWAHRHLAHGWHVDAAGAEILSAGTGWVPFAGQ